MKHLIISGSNRKDSGSRKVSNYIHSVLEDSEVFDLHEKDIPLWREDVWNDESDQAQSWQKYANILSKADGFVFVVPEWGGMISAPMANFLQHLSFEEMAHKPVLLVSVSSGRGGTYPIAQMRAFSFKNNSLVYIPDHVIVRDVSNVLNNVDIDENDKSDMFIKKRLIRSIDILRYYTNHLSSLRQDMNLSIDDYPFGM
jgi:NAD(P)H-dependent FMN reductase